MACGRDERFGRLLSGIHYGEKASNAHPLQKSAKKPAQCEVEGVATGFCARVKGYDNRRCSLRQSLGWRVTSRHGEPAAPTL